MDNDNKVDEGELSMLGIDSKASRTAKFLETEKGKKCKNAKMAKNANLKSAERKCPATT